MEIPFPSYLQYNLVYLKSDEIYVKVIELIFYKTREKLLLAACK
jgi:hypothetical protein